jgi:uncharacterized protein YacL
MDKQETTMNRTLKTIFFFGKVGVLVALIYSILIIDIFSLNIANFLEMIATIMSILICLVATYYTYISGEKTISLLNKIETQNKNLVDKINQDLLEEAYDENGIKDARARRPQ